MRVPYLSLYVGELCERACGCVLSMRLFINAVKAVVPDGRSLVGLCGNCSHSCSFFESLPPSELETFEANKPSLQNNVVRVTSTLFFS